MAAAAEDDGLATVVDVDVVVVVVVVVSVTDEAVADVLEDAAQSVTVRQRIDISTHGCNR